MYIVRKYYIDKNSRQLFLDQLLDVEQQPKAGMKIYGSASTVTRWYDSVPAELEDAFNAEAAFQHLNDLVSQNEKLFLSPAHTHYKHYTIPKKSGGGRPIDEPNQQLDNYLRRLKYILKHDFFMSHHTNAYAYVKNRNTLDCVKLHKGSNWFMKTDFSNFFGSTTPDIAWRILELIYPFNIFMQDTDQKEILKKALSMAFLDNGLPQGTTLSPDLTNLIMIPFDAMLSAKMRKINVVYTRYADDCIFSGKYKFSKDKIETMIRDTLKNFRYPYEINSKKTRFGSVKGKNWNLGLMLNGSHQITIGAETKHRLKIDLHNLLMDYENHKEIDRQWLESLMGRIHYYKFIEPDFIDNLIIEAVKKRTTRIGYWYYYPKLRFQYIVRSIRYLPITAWQ